MLQVCMINVNDLFKAVNCIICIIKVNMVIKKTFHRVKARIVSLQEVCNVRSNYALGVNPVIIVIE